MNISEYGMLSTGIQTKTFLEQHNELIHPETNNLLFKWAIHVEMRDVKIFFYFENLF
jgi:hypothetical protein